MKEKTEYDEQKKTWINMSDRSNSSKKNLRKASKGKAQELIIIKMQLNWFDNAFHILKWQNNP